MTGPAILAALLSLAEPEQGTVRGLPLSIGSGRNICARVTFDRRVAREGGRIFVLDAARPGDEEAIRLSQGVLVRRGSLTSRAGETARRHGVAAVSLGQGRMDASGAALYLNEPTYGPPAKASGFAYRPVEGFSERVIKEGDAISLDAMIGGVTLIAPEEAQDRVAAFEAASAYDGLRSVEGLELWLTSSGGSARRAVALLEELVSRAAAGTMPIDDFSRVRRKAEAEVVAASREDLRGAERRMFHRALGRLQLRAQDCAFDLDEARAAAAGVEATARLLSVSDEGTAKLARSCRDELQRRAIARGRGGAGDLAQAAVASGADRSQGWDLPPEAWSSFVAANDLSGWLKQTVDDASLGLRLKSERIRERILSGRLDPSSALGAALLTKASEPSLVIGPDGALKSEGRADILERVKQAWAASWDPGPLGARLRASNALSYQGRLRIERIESADVSGVAFSRDPGSGRRERIFIEAAAGSLDRILSGEGEVEAISLDRRTGRALWPRTRATLSAEQLARVARLALGLDAWKGAGVEVAFSFRGSRLLVHHSRALEPPRPLILPAR